jgi:hypothetical protein
MRWPGSYVARLAESLHIPVDRLRSYGERGHTRTDYLEAVPAAHTRASVVPERTGLTTSTARSGPGVAGRRCTGWRVTREISAGPLRRQIVR